MSRKSNKAYYNKLVQIIVAEDLANDIDYYIPDKFMLTGEDWKESTDIYYIKRFHHFDVDKIIDETYIR